jgi:hypothetical protein
MSFPHPAALATSKSVVFQDLDLLVFLIAFLFVEIMMLLQWWSENELP